MSHAFSRLFLKFKWPLIATVIVLMIAGCIINVITVRNAQVPDWYMHLAMWALLGIYMVLGLNTLLAGRRLRAVLTLTMLAFLCLFWIVILIGKIPAEKAVHLDQIIQRPPLTSLWYVVGILAVCTCCYLLLTVEAFLLPRREKSTK